MREIENSRATTKKISRHDRNVSGSTIGCRHGLSTQFRMGKTAYRSIHYRIEEILPLHCIQTNISFAGKLKSFYEKASKLFQESS
nr:hypothetical protein [Porphyromonas gulae]